jgi:hypothetical protein
MRWSATAPGNSASKPAQKFQKLLVPVTRIALADHLAFHHLQGGKERGGAVSFVVVGQGAAAAFLERQSRLRAVQRLNLTLLVHAQHHGVLRRGQIDAHHVGQFLQELRVARELESSLLMGPQFLLLPEPMHGAFAQALGARQRARAPVRGPGWTFVERGRDGCRDFLRSMAGLASATGRDLPDATDALGAHALAPERGGRPPHLQGLSDLFILLTLGRPEENAATQGDLLRSRTSAQPFLEPAQFGFGQNDGRTLAGHPAML